VTRPVIAIPGRFAASTSALRYRAVVTARALASLVHDAGGEPVTVLPWPDGDRLSGGELDDRLGFADAVLLPGGGDLDPARYGQPRASEHVYDVDPLQDAVDLAVATWALDRGLPLLAVCRGLHVVNVALGGTLEQHMATAHRAVEAHAPVGAAPVGALEHVHTVSGGDWPNGLDLPEQFDVSCYHHQRIADLGADLDVVAWAGDGTVEAVTRPSSRDWFLGVQWHPEDRPDDAISRQLMVAFVEAARAGRRPAQLQRVAAYALAIRNDHVLLVRLSDRTEYAGAWTLPGGGIDFGEAPADGVLRELHEETGLAGDVDALLGVQSSTREPLGGWPDVLHAVRVVYRVTVHADGPLVIHDVGGSTDAVAWVPLAELDQLQLSPVVRFALERIAHGGAPA
jgi:putative glutamine amidotransferase